MTLEEALLELKRPLKFGDARQVAAVDFLASVSKAARLLKKLNLTNDELEGVQRWIKKELSKREGGGPWRSEKYMGAPGPERHGR